MQSKCEFYKRQEINLDFNPHLHIALKISYQEKFASDCLKSPEIQITIANTIKLME